MGYQITPIIKLRNRAYMGEVLKSKWKVWIWAGLQSYERTGDLNTRHIDKTHARES